MKNKNGQKIAYPSSDDIPMAETAINIHAIVDLWEVLRIFFKNRTDVFTYVDTFWYWEEGNVSARITPDVLVVTGTQPRDILQRPSFFSWEEKTAVPAAVFEFASENTWRPMKGKKFKHYEAIGARVFPCRLRERVSRSAAAGISPGNGVYRAIEHQEGTVASTLGFGMRIEKYRLRLIDSLTNEPILNHLEAIEKSREERGNLEAQRHEQEKQRADEYTRRADAAELELKRLRALLQKYGLTDGGSS